MILDMRSDTTKITIVERSWRGGKIIEKYLLEITIIILSNNYVTSQPYLIFLSESLCTGVLNSIL